MYHITSNANAASIRDSGGLMPLQHQENKGAGLDAMRGESHGGADQSVKAHIDNLRLTSEMGLPEPDRGLILRSSRHDAEEAIRHGSNPQTLYMTKEDSAKDYMLNPHFSADGAVLLRAQLDPKENGFVKDDQGKLGDQRSLGLKVPNSQLEYTKLTPAQTRDIGISGDDRKLTDLQWKPMPQAGEPL